MLDHPIVDVALGLILLYSTHSLVASVVKEWISSVLALQAKNLVSKMPVTAVQILNNHVLPFFEEQGVKIRTILSDNGREYRSRPDRHPYELFLQLEDIEHRTTKVGRPQSNGFIERFHRTLLEEHLRIKGRTTVVWGVGSATIAMGQLTSCHLRFMVSNISYSLL